MSMDSWLIVLQFSLIPQVLSLSCFGEGHRVGKPDVDVKESVEPVK